MVAVWRKLSRNFRWQLFLIPFKIKQCHRIKSFTSAEIYACTGSFFPNVKSGKTAATSIIKEDTSIK